MTGIETWHFVAPVLLQFLREPKGDEWMEVYVNVFNGLLLLDKKEKEALREKGR